MRLSLQKVCLMDELETLRLDNQRLKAALEKLLEGFDWFSTKNDDRMIQVWVSDLHRSVSDALSGIDSLPRFLGSTPSGQPVCIGRGRLGPFIRYGHKYVSLKNEDPSQVTLERALELIQEHQSRHLGTPVRYVGEGFDIRNFPEGLFLTKDRRRAKLPVPCDPWRITIDECRQLITTHRWTRTRSSYCPLDYLPDEAKHAATIVRAHIIRATSNHFLRQNQELWGVLSHLWTQFSMRLGWTGDQGSMTIQRGLLWALDPATYAGGVVSNTEQYMAAEILRSQEFQVNLVELSKILLTVYPCGNAEV